MITTCSQCNTELNRKPSVLARCNDSYCSSKCSTIAHQKDAKCMHCKKLVSVRRSVDKVFCSSECKEAHAVISAQCTWPGCANNVSVRVNGGRKHVKYYMYPSPTGKMHYGKHPICTEHFTKLIEFVGPNFRLNSYFKIVRRGNGDMQDQRSPGSRIMRFILWDRQGGKCKSCEASLNFDAPMKTWEVDHIHPWFKGGKNTIDNLQVLCFACHNEKSKSEKSEAARFRHLRTGPARNGTHRDKNDRIIQLERECARLKSILARYQENEELAG